MVRPGRHAACDLDVKRRITVQEIRIESFFPMDEVTAGFFRKPAPAKGG